MSLARPEVKLNLLVAARSEGLSWLTVVSCPGRGGGGGGGSGRERMHRPGGPGRLLRGPRPRQVTGVSSSAPRPL